MIGRQTDNPGPWFLHCHIDFHLEAGFAVVFAEGANETSAANPTPGKCPILGVFLYGLLIENYRGLEQPLHYLQRSR